jgi:hypothetical protein
MAIDLKSLKATVGKLSDKFKNRTVVTIEDTSFALELITPLQEAECQKYALEILQDLKEGEDASQPYLVMYWDRMRDRCLSFAIKQINGEDIPEFLETGDLTKDGKPVKMERSKILLGMIRQWTRPLLHALFFAYGKLAEDAEVDADKYIDYSSKNIDTHIEIMEGRLERLRESKAAQVKNTVSLVTSQMENYAKAEEARRQDRQQIIDSPNPIGKEPNLSKPTVSDKEPKEDNYTEVDEALVDLDTDSIMSVPLKEPNKYVPETNPVNKNKGSFTKPEPDENVNFVPTKANRNDEPPEVFYYPPKGKNWDEIESDPVKSEPVKSRADKQAGTLEKIKGSILHGSMDQFLATLQPKDQSFVRRFGIEKYAKSLDDGTINEWRASNDKRKVPMPSPVPQQKR